MNSENDIVVEIDGAVTRFEHLRFAEPINWTIRKGQHWAIIGANGAGKTLLIDILLGKHALKEGKVNTGDRKISERVKSVSFKDIYSLSDTQNSYYQQRWNAGASENSKQVKDLFENIDADWLSELVSSFSIEDLLEKEITLLSSGELRKTLIVKSLLSKPDILVLDNPFIGLDADSRVVLNDLLERFSGVRGLQIVLILSNPSDIPPLVTNILTVKNKSLQEYVSTDKIDYNRLFGETTSTKISELKVESNLLGDFDNALVFKDIHVKYGRRTILNDLNWQVKRGEKWALLGKNGAGKSTLLSLVSGDNPQAYANDITLFDRKRGTGESIWDIKKRIGYISPEMHLFYLKNVPCADVVGSGFFDTIGLYRKCSDEQLEVAKEWMRAFGIAHLSDISFLNVSSGEQRLVLLARLFVKNPDLLILDEPLHGLDVNNKKLVKSIIEDFCDADKALIYVTHYENEIPSVVDKRLVLTKFKG